jgi:hypothetical protein
MLGLLTYAAYRHQCVISPASVRADALGLLKRDPAICEVLQLPITATGPLLSITDGGHVRFKVRSLQGAFATSSWALQAHC